MSDVPPVFQTVGASVRLGASEVVHDVDFELDPGEFVVLLGPNGSGKTTLVKALLGLVDLARGRRAVFGRDLEAFKRWDLVGYVPQRVTAATGVPATVEEVVLSGRAGKVGFLSRFGSSDRDAVLRALDVVDLTSEAATRVDVLSGGQQQRVLIARALATEPAVLVMDEPVASVDMAHQESFAATLEELHSSGTSILLVAHSLGAMAPLAQRAVVIERGVVIYDGPPEDDLVLEHAHPHHPDHDPEHH